MTEKRNTVRHRAKLSNMLDKSNTVIFLQTVVIIWKKCLKTSGYICFSPIFAFRLLSLKLLHLNLNLSVTEPTYCKTHTLRESKKIVTIQSAVYLILFLSLKWLKNVRFGDIYIRYATFTGTLLRNNFSLKVVYLRPY